MAVESSSNELIGVVSLLGAAVVAVPLFKRLGLGSVLGYLAAGLAIGPFGLGLFKDSHSILHVAELGVVMFLFIIGLEMRPSHLWAMRKAIFGLGSLQVLFCGIALTGVGLAFGFPLPVAFVSAMGFVLTSTAVVMQLLGERGDLAAPRGQRMVAILLLEDLLIVPLLAVIVFLAPTDIAPAGAAHAVASGSRWASVGMALGAVAALVAVGLWLLNPLFRVLAKAHAREVMTAAALLVVLGSALLMQQGGLSMEMGAFVAGVLLSESAFRHQLEADIEPFRGLLLGLFFLAVGMSLDLNVVRDNLLLIAAGVILMMIVKALGIYATARLARSTHEEALDRAVLMAQGGEFAFVLYSAALASHVIDPQVNANMTAIVVLSMALTPLVVLVHKRLRRPARRSVEGLETPSGGPGSVLVVGFGRVGQIVSQHVLAFGAEITIIDNDPFVIDTAAEYGFKVYYGDASRLDVLYAAGAQSARAIVLCIDDREATTRAVELLKSACPHARVLARAFDREHAVELMKVDVDFQVREAFESSMVLGRQTALAAGASNEIADQINEDLRRRDKERFEREVVGGLSAGRALLYRNLPTQRN